MADGLVVSQTLQDFCLRIAKDATDPPGARGREVTWVWLGCDSAFKLHLSRQAWRKRCARDLWLSPLGMAPSHRSCRRCTPCKRASRRMIMLWRGPVEYAPQTARGMWQPFTRSYTCLGRKGYSNKRSQGSSLYGRQNLLTKPQGPSTGSTGFQKPHSSRIKFFAQDSPLSVG